jgi:hypothetical protein
LEYNSEKNLIFWELFLPDLRVPTAPDLIVPLFFIFDFLVFSFISFGFISFGFISFGENVTVLMGKDYLKKGSLTASSVFGTRLPSFSLLNRYRRENNMRLSSSFTSTIPDGCRQARREDEATHKFPKL